MAGRILSISFIFWGFLSSGGAFAYMDSIPSLQKTSHLISKNNIETAKVHRHLASIFGSDDRTLIGASSPIKKVRRKVGKLISSKGDRCTASLVGNNLILTAAHCITKKGSSMLSKNTFTFYLGYSSGSYIAQSSIKSIWWAEQRAQKARHNDWIILSLEKNLGYKYGYFGTHVLNSLNFRNTSISLAGYGDAFFGGQKLSATSSCRIKNHYNGNYRTLLHDCDSGEGDSGAPLFFCNSKECKIVAIHSSDHSKENTTSKIKKYSDQLGNVAISSSQFEEDIRQLRKSQN